MSDIILNYTERGSGKPLVLLHGNGESSEYFINQITCFSKHFRVIAVDTRGHGKTPRGKKPFTLSQFAEDLKGFFDYMHISKAHILGFSDGGNIALLFALKYPQSVDFLIMNGANLFPSGVKASAQLPVYIGHALVSVFSPFSKKSKAKKEMLGLMTNQPDIKPDELTKLNVPTLVIVGTKDMIKDTHSVLISSSLPDSRLVRIEGDHFIANKNPIEFNRTVMAFLNGK